MRILFTDVSLYFTRTTPNPRNLPTLVPSPKMSATNDQDSVQITAQCLCRAHTFTATVPRASLPLKASACHCTSCRHVTGALYSIDALWPGDPDVIHSSSLQRYDFSGRIKTLFCGTCSSTMFWDIVLPQDESTGTPTVTGRELGVFTGVLQRDGPKGLVRLVEHMCVGDTVDGGASMWMRRPNGDGVPVTRWAGVRQTSKTVPEAWPGTTRPAATCREGGWHMQDMSIRCHCQGVDLVYRSSEANAEFMAAEPAELPRMADPVTKKPIVGMDACDSCTRSFGVDFVHWTFSFLRHIGFAASAALEPSQSRHADFPPTLAALYAAVSTKGPLRDPRFGTLAVYESSGRAKRYFCSRCSACVFYAADARHDIVNVAMGLFDAPEGEGARAEGTFLWLLGGQVQHREDIASGWREDWLSSVEAEYEAWRVERRFPEWWRWVQRQPKKGP